MKKSLFLLTTLPFLFAACSKSGSGSGANNPPGSGTTDLIKTMTFVIHTSPGKIDTIANTYTYDGQNRCIQSISVSGKRDTVNYTYTSNTMTATESISATTFYLNGTGAADSAHWIYNSPGFPFLSIAPYVVTTVYRYSYDSKGYLASSRTYLETSQGDSLEDATVFTVTNGNITLINDTVTQTSAAYTYGNQTTATGPLPPGPLDAAFIGISPVASWGNLYGHSNTNLVATLPGLSMAYSLDSRNRISSVTETPLDPTATGYTLSVVSFTYY